MSRRFGTTGMGLPFDLLGTCLAVLLSLSSAGVLRSQIVGGHEARPHSRPYTAALKINGRFGCGGFLVAPQWVMSAAHCMGDIMVILGGHDLDAVEETQQVFGVTDYYPHPGFSWQTTKDDILLLKLDRKVTLNKYVQIVSLPTSDDYVLPNTNCLVAGWGLIDEMQKPDSKLFETNLTVVNRRQCRQLVPIISEGQMCAGSQSKISDVSHGDSGSALVCNGVAHGIVSYGFYFPPSIYTRIAAYLPWIQETMNEG